MRRNSTLSFQLRQHSPGIAESFQQFFDPLLRAPSWFWNSQTRSLEVAAPSSTGGLRRTASHPELPTKSAKSSSNLMEHHQLFHFSWLRNTAHIHHMSSVAKKKLPTRKCCESASWDAKAAKVWAKKGMCTRKQKSSLNCCNLTFNANHIMTHVSVKYKILQLQCQYVCIYKLYIYNLYIHIEIIFFRLVCPSFSPKSQGSERSSSKAWTRRVKVQSCCKVEFRWRSLAMKNENKTKYERIHFCKPSTYLFPQQIWKLRIDQWI